MNRIRSFLAVNLPVPLIEQVRSLQDQLRDRARSSEVKVAWVPPPNMHVTVKFLGDIPQESALVIRDQLQPVLEGRGAIQLDVGGLGVFPSIQKPRVLWVGVQSTGDALGTLAGEIDSRLEQLGFEPESRPFHAHLTLGRVKQGQAPDLLEGLEDASFGQCSIHEVVLYKSVLQRAGAEYTAMARIPLAARRPVEP